MNAWKVLIEDGRITAQAEEKDVQDWVLTQDAILPASLGPVVQKARLECTDAVMRRGRVRHFLPVVTAG